MEHNNSWNLFETSEEREEASNPMNIQFENAHSVTRNE